MPQKTKSNPKKNSNKRDIKRIAILLIVAAVLVTVYLLMFSSNKTSIKNNDKTDKIEKEMVNIFLKHGELTFNSSAGEFISTIEIEIAEDDKKRADGLMFRKGMKEYQGMFFIFPYESRQSFWMRNTALSLDMLFVNSKNEIVTIHKNTTPFSDESYPSAKPSICVIEVLAGYTEKYGIKNGDKIVWRRI